jgi:hypothetical protein
MMGKVMPVELDGPGCRFVFARKQFDQRAFARPIMADNRAERPGRKADRDVFKQRLWLFAVTFERDVFQVEHRQKLTRRKMETAPSPDCGKQARCKI